MKYAHAALLVAALVAAVHLCQAQSSLADCKSQYECLGDQTMRFLPPSTCECCQEPTATAPDCSPARKKECSIGNCKECASPSTCGMCYPGWGLNGDATACVTCVDPNCVVCRFAIVCEKCETGYVVENGVCVKENDGKCHVPHCYECEVNNPNECIVCDAGYRLCVKCGKTKCVPIDAGSSVATALGMGAAIGAGGLGMLLAL